MKPTEIRNMTEAEIEHTLRTLKEKQYGLRAEAISGRVEKNHTIRAIKRDIAKCLTILKEKEREGKKR
ncbi:MAG: 50S ribosomal protein L29 [Candidatus Omnitrophica bacterium]|nr:50S ribosomal protein L29 [Candidatus Omnitrophota bacterium]